MILACLLLAPLTAGIVSSLLRRRAMLEIANLAGFGLTFLLAFTLAFKVVREGPVSLLDEIGRAHV